MAMKPVFEIKLFRPNGTGEISDRERQRSQMALIWMMEALCQINQGLIRYQRDIGKPYPLLYSSGIFYKREPPPVSSFADAAAGCNAGEDYCDVDKGVLQRAPEFWQDIATNFEKGYGDCEDLACHRIAELREVFKRQASPMVTYRIGPDGSYKFHALLAARGPHGWRCEDPSRKLGMGWEGKFQRVPRARLMDIIAKIDAVQKQVSPEKFSRMHKVRV